MRIARAEKIEKIFKADMKYPDAQDKRIQMFKLCL
jgi:hypothetical protein